VRLGYSRRDKLADVERRLAQHGIIPAGFVVTGGGRSRREGLTGGPEGRVEPPISVDGNAARQPGSGVPVP
jgi:hypothetical protein